MMLTINHYMFSYGMNTNLTSMKYRCPKAKRMGMALLDDHAFQFKYHADVEIEFGSTVEGVLWQLDQDGLDLIDRCEGYPDYYIRDPLWVRCDDGLDYQAWVYKMRNEQELNLPNQSYLDMVHEGYVQNDLDVQQIWSAMERCHASRYQGA